MPEAFPPSKLLRQTTTIKDKKSHNLGQSVMGNENLNKPNNNICHFVLLPIIIMNF